MQRLRVACVVVDDFGNLWKITCCDTARWYWPAPGRESAALYARFGLDAWGKPLQTPEVFIRPGEPICLETPATTPKNVRTMASPK